MTKYFMFLMFIILSCNSKTQDIDKTITPDCNDKWNFKNSNVTEKEINDSTTQEIADGKVWFEIISPKDIGNGISKAYIKNYRMDGSLLSEGWAKYHEHPVADYEGIGIWKFYDCHGKPKKKNYR
jgi:hypothetical protein